MFSCKRCLEKNDRIVDLKEQVSFLRSMTVSSSDPTPRQMEADAILNGTDRVIDITPEEKESVEDVASEEARILSGTY